MIRTCTILTFMMLCAACAKFPEPAMVGETRECSEYRAMMTAPMPPAQHERLRLACEASKPAK